MLASVCSTAQFRRRTRPLIPGIAHVLQYNVSAFALHGYATQAKLAFG